MIRAGRRGSPSDGLIARQLKGLGPFYKRPNTRCERGKNLAQPADFAEQRALSRRMLDWYNIYPILYRRMDSGRTTAACQLFCGGGGSSEGVRRSGGVSIGVDLYDQPDYVYEQRGRVRRNADCECGLRTANRVYEPEFAGMRIASADCGLRTGCTSQSSQECGLRVRTADCERALRSRSFASLCARRSPGLSAASISTLPLSARGVLAGFGLLVSSWDRYSTDPLRWLRYSGPVPSVTEF